MIEKVMSGQMTEDGRLLFPRDLVQRQLLKRRKSLPFVDKFRRMICISQVPVCICRQAGQHGVFDIDTGRIGIRHFPIFTMQRGSSTEWTTFIISADQLWHGISMTAR